jgi:hypothetical protein
MSDGCHQNERRDQAGGDTVSSRLSGLQLVRGVLPCGRHYNKQEEILAFDDGMGIVEAKRIRGIKGLLKRTGPPQKIGG